MIIYQKELNDGLEDSMKAKASVTLSCQILSKDVLIENVENIQKSLASCNEESPDLFRINSVLVSTGWNKNDDVFIPDQIWAAKDTPINKQFNYMHNDNDIIGHITNSMIIDKNGNLISDEVPEELDVVTSSVIYRAWSDPKCRERIEALISEILEGKWAVSMECIFSDFDYAIKSTDGDKVLARSEESAFLTKHLRVYGGTGEYQGYKVGRLLKGFYFSGVGLVDQPANPRSIIFKRDVDPFSKKTNIEVTNFLAAMEITMPKEEKLEVDFKSKAEQLQVELAASVAEVTEIKSLSDEQKATSDSVIASLEAKIADLDREIAAFKDKMKEKQKELDDMSEDCSKNKKAMKCMKRKASLIVAGLADDKISDLITKFEDASDEMFESVVALLADSKPAPQAEPEQEQVESEDSLATDLETVEEVKTEALANPTDENSRNATVASAAQWIRSSVLKTTKNLKDKE